MMMLETMQMSEASTSMKRREPGRRSRHLTSQFNSDGPDIMSLVLTGCRMYANRRMRKVVTPQTAVWFQVRSLHDRSFLTPDVERRYLNQAQWSAKPWPRGMTRRSHARCPDPSSAMSPTSSVTSSDCPSSSSSTSRSKPLSSALSVTGPGGSIPSQSSSLNGTDTLTPWASSSNDGAGAVWFSPSHGPTDRAAAPGAVIVAASIT